MYDVERKHAVVRYVQDRSRETLITIIQEIVLPGSIIFSDIVAVRIHSRDCESQAEFR